MSAVPEGYGSSNRLKACRLGVDTHTEPVVFLHKESPVCRAEGFEAFNRVLLTGKSKEVIATLFQVSGDLIGPWEAALSDEAWTRLEIGDDEEITVTHQEPLESLSLVRSRIYGHPLPENSLYAIIHDIADRRYSNVEIAAFLTACSAIPLSPDEVFALTRAMVSVGDRLTWDRDVIVDKHSIGGVPGNRTTPIIVSIVTALDLTMPKTSSRAITSPAGTADTMEVLAPVTLDRKAIHRVVEQEGGCIVWGGAVRLSPADDILIRVERALDIDTEGQMIASVLSKKIAAGATHIVLDVPLGPTAKVRTRDSASRLSEGLLHVAGAFGIKAKVLIGDGTQPIGRGVGPVLEACDVLAVLRNEVGAPADLRARALELSGAIIELAGLANPGAGAAMAANVLEDGRAWAKFQRICEAQGGMRSPKKAPHRRPVAALQSGYLSAIDNRRIAKLAKLAGAPEAPGAGLELHVRVADKIAAGDPLCTVYAEAPGELAYAMHYADANPDIVCISDNE